MATVHQDARGKFKKGNTAAIGNKGGRPRRSVEESYLEKMVGVVTLKRWAVAVNAVLEKAEKGDVTAFKVLAGYGMGLPTVYITADVTTDAEGLEEWRSKRAEREQELEEMKEPC